jgi:predicted RNA polymerase sigma factor
LQAVLETIYLLFNEGYSASTGKDLIRYEICEEAIRLTEIIADHAAIQNKSTVYALLALMQLNASRFAARLDAEGNILTLEQQNRSLWNFKLIGKGFSNLEKFTLGEEISIYHILATISAYHCSAANYQSTDWESILSLYNQLIQIDNSVVVLLNRAVALSKVSGAEVAIRELEKLQDTPPIKSYHLFYSVLAEFYIQILEFDKATEALKTAIALAPLETERSFLQKRLVYCREKIF